MKLLLKKRFSNLHFFVINNYDFLQVLNIPNEYKNLDKPKVIIFKNYDEYINIYTDSFEYEKLTYFIKSYVYPLLNRLSIGNYIHVVNEKINFMVLLFYKAENINQELAANMAEYAKKLRGNVFFMYGCLEDQNQTTLALDFDVIENPQQLPQILVQEYINRGDRVKILRYKSETINSLNQIDVFLSNYLEHKLKPFLRSEKLPLVFKNNIYNLVGSNFESFINDNNYFDIVFFTKKNCGLCVEEF
jgi:hypothetical protein